MPGEVEDIVALLADADARRRKRARAVHREEELERELPLLDEDLAQWQVGVTLLRPQFLASEVGPADALARQGEPVHGDAA